MPAEHSGQMSHEARHTGFDPRAGLPTIQSVVILLHSVAGLDEGQREKLGDKGAVAVAFFDNAIAFYERGETQRAWEFFNRALTIFRGVGALEYEAKTLTNLGAACSSLGKQRQALDHFKEALPAFQGIDDRYGEACTLHNLGAVYYTLDEPRQALKFHNLALPIFKELSDWKHAAFALGNIGLAYYQLGEWPLALEAFKQGRVIFKELGHKSGEACALYTIGVTHNNSGEIRLALEAFKQAEPLYEELNHRSGKGFMLYNIGIAHDNLGEPQYALEAFVEAQEIYKELGDRENEATILKWVKAMEAKSLDKSRPSEVSSDAQPEQGGEPSGEGAITEAGTPEQPETQEGRMPASPNTKRAKGQVTVRTNRHRPGYVDPARDGGKQINITLPKEEVEAFGAFARAKGTSMKAVLESYIAECIKEGLPQPEREKLAKKEIARVLTKFGVNAKRVTPKP